MRLAAFIVALFPALWGQERLDLHELIAEALQSNPEILAAQKRLEAARQRPAQQRALPDPMISLGYNSSGNPLPGAGLGREPTANLGWMLSQELPYPGKLALRSNVAAKEAGAEAEQYRAVEWSVVSRLKQAYHRLHHTYDIEDILVRSREVLRTLLRASEARYSVGKAPQADVFRAQTQITLIETRMEQMLRERRARQAEINSLLARRLDAPLAEPAAMPAPALKFTLDVLLAKAQDSSPMIARDQKMIERADISLNLARKDYYPDVTLNGGYYYMGSMPPMYMLRADVKIPLRLGRTRASITEQSFNASAARRSYEATEQSLQYRIKDDYLTAETSIKLMDLYKQTVIPQTRLAVQSALAAYETGATDFSAALMNQMAAIEYEMTYHEEMQNFYLAISRLEEMVGAELPE